MEHEGSFCLTSKWKKEYHGKASGNEYNQNDLVEK